MYRQIAEEIGYEIESGQLAPGSQLPTEVELRDRYQASRNTIRDAIRLLVTRGLVGTRPGQGTFVLRKIEPFTVRLGTQLDRGSRVDGAYHLPDMPRSGRVESTVPQVEILRGTGQLCEELRIPEGTQLVSRHQLRYIDSMPWSLQTSFYPMRLVTSGAARLISAEDIASGTTQYLAEALNLRQVGWNERLAVRPPAAREAAFFNLPPDGRVAVIETIRTVFDQTGTPIRVTATVYPADRNQFIMTVGEVPMPDLEAAEPVGHRTDDRAPAAVAWER